MLWLKFLSRPRTKPEISGVFSTYSANEPRLKIVFDRNKLNYQGLTIADLQSTLQSHLGSRYIGQYLKYGRKYMVLIQAEQDQRAQPDDILDLHVKKRQRQNGSPKKRW